jgi:phosphoribosylanthranilate isomerase
MFVKICGVTTAEDALLAAGLGADAVGLNFAAASPRRISVGQATDIVNRLPPDVLAVGIFQNELKERVVEITERVGLHAAQLHGHEPPGDCRWIGQRVPAVIKVFSVSDPALRSGDDFGPHRLLVDSPVGGSGKVFDWTLLDEAVGGRPYILAGGLNPDNVGPAIEMLGPWGVDVASGVESAPGRKDPAKVRRFIAAARDAAASMDRWEYRSGSEPGAYGHALIDEPVPAVPYSDPPSSADRPRSADHRATGLNLDVAETGEAARDPFDWEGDQ